MTKIKVGIIGGTGYTGAELLRLAVIHPQVDLVVVGSRSESGRAVSDLYPGLRGLVNLEFVAPEQKAYMECDVVFSATPNGIAMQHAPELLAHGVRFIDLAADFRLNDAAVWQHWYGQEHSCPELIREAVYGLPELNRKQIKTAQLIANPGCYPTATTLGLLPLLKEGLVDPTTLIADAKSGVSGAGRSASVANLFCEVTESFKSYAASAHRHHPEISQTLSSVANKEASLTFIPHLVPMLRGIHATLYADLKEEISLEYIQQTFEKFYANEPFVDVLPSGSHPETRSVKSTNTCRLAVHQATGSGKLVVLSVIDNLTKGAAGQAIQNMNIMFGLDETAGLVSPALMP